MSAMNFPNYRVGLVVSRAGLTDAQLAQVKKRLADIVPFITDGGKIELYVPGYDISQPEGSIPPEVANLQYREKVRVCFIGIHSDQVGAAGAIRYFLQEKYSCDEIWCCPALSQTGRSQARVAQVYTTGQAGPKARLYKMIPPWVDMPGVVTPKRKPEAPPRQRGKGKKNKKGKAAYRALFDHRMNF